ncbi:poly-beta-1,6-N-acetyl-D-glucosamine N-deacetylase PgaB [Acinetobacter terrae]|uniref:poly-beta-1,6-N-acetyl-D-glucosamine N-deacetylase PgaB n=1 Tax=Acinetobacter terrae TaxID=2731247 RepID=UPI0007D7DE6D|nr:poly-beta-1,6-N-acetyl-D-glucosamine N-deacetylase PgaB [Acinetobacter terrae]NNG77365.1 poly-beta-1,6-N-acetyl-D-glucosamine N-deacetylase PgaB [Acinetobacter terrae]NNH15669.1 poly-beta-1,6-N-acetyl-D-glucosamine N-deacetylase PgaB [Acinetobacter terrae]OAL83573.1 poly-beta-1,6-N-acetyl-D-glucosamine N-deacetylase PgaB [Acinetobacter terrae]
MNTRLLSTLLSTSLSAVLWQIPHLAWSQTPAHNPTLTVIGYHEIINTENALIPEYAVSTTQFQQHIDWLKKNGFHFINVDQLIQAHQGKYSLPTKPVLLTVDDGYASFYQNAYPIVKANKIPVVLAVVGSWLEPKEDQNIDFSGEQIQRKEMLSWAELKEMQDSGLVEMASHSYNLHRGIVGNPQGNLEPAAVTRLYDPKSASYEDDSHYQQRISNDLKQNNQLLIAHGLKSPRIMVWPYGHYNMQTVKIAKQLGMPVAISLDDGADSAKSSLGQLNRILIEGNMTTADLAREIQNRQQHLGDNNRPQKIMHIDLDYIYDKDPIQQERNLDHLLDRIVATKVNTVYLQAFSDPDANGSADMVYFPNHYLPMRADLFNRVAWQIQTRTQVGRVYAWMPLLAWELPKNNPVSKDVVETQQTEDSQHLNMGYRRLSPFSPDARKTISGIYQDLAKSVPFNGILFHDDTTLSDYEDASPEALKAYAAIGLPTDLAKIRSNDADLQKWTAYKTKYIDDFALQLAQQVRQYHPFLLTARNLYAQVALKPYAENWYSQSLEQSINRYDFTAIMAMPYMEQAANSDAFYRDIVNRVKQFPKGIKKTVFELQAVNWRTNQKVPSDEMAQTIQSLYEQGAMHVAYYPDDPIQDHPDTRVLRKAFDLKSSKLVP